MSPKTSSSTPPTGAVGPPTASHRLPSYTCSKMERASPIIQPQSLLVSPSKTPEGHLVEKPRGVQTLPPPTAVSLHSCYEASIHSYPLTTITSTAPNRNAYSSVTHQRPAHYHHHHHHHNPASQVNNTHLQTGKNRSHILQVIVRYSKIKSMQILVYECHNRSTTHCQQNYKHLLRLTTVVATSSVPKLSNYALAPSYMLSR